MALEGLFIRTKRELGGIQLDAVISESHSGSVRVTDNPVEFGAKITDHSVVEPKTLTLVAEVTDNPLGFAAVTEIIDTITGFFGTTTSENVTRSVAAYNALEALRDAREPIDVQTGLRLYENMLITKIDVIRDKDNRRIVNMVIPLKEVIIVETEVIALPADTLEEGSTRDQGTSNIDKGKKAEVVPTPTQETSILKSVFDWVVGG